MSSDEEGAPQTDQLALVEQYKVYVNRSSDVSNRRLKTNRFYVSLLSGGIAAIGLLVQPQELSSIRVLGLGVIGVVGVALCVNWLFNIWSYEQLNEGKYAVIHDMEKKLPHSCYKEEWEKLDEGENNRTYLTHWKVERVVPGILALPYLLLALYAVWTLFEG